MEEITLSYNEMKLVMIIKDVGNSINFGVFDSHALLDGNIVNILGYGTPVFCKSGSGTAWFVFSI